MRWRPYLSILRIRFIAGLQYRVAALAGVAINLFWGLILVTILILFYRWGQYPHPGITLAQGVTYIWLGQCFMSLIPMQMDTEVYQKITSGDLAYELCRPLDLYGHWFARIAANRLSNTFLKSWIALIFCVILPAPYGIQPPVSGEALVFFGVALIGALFLSCALSNLMSVSLLRVEWGPGLNSLFLSTITLCSGLLIPLSVFPDWLQPILRALPFAGMMDFPCALYTGIIPVSGAWSLIGRQWLWVIALVWLGKWRLEKGLRRTVIQGG